MIERIRQELAMLKGWWPNLEYVEVGHWVHLSDYVLADGIWRQSAVEVAFRIPANLPGEQPYGFYVRPGLVLTSGQSPQNYTHPTSEPPFGSDLWGKFSWAPVEWHPSADPTKGSNMVDFARSIGQRLREAS